MDIKTQSVLMPSQKDKLHEEIKSYKFKHCLICRFLFLTKKEDEELCKTCLEPDKYIRFEHNISKKISKNLYRELKNSFF